MDQSRRLSSLDGLRGIAALVVLVHHSLLLIPAFLAPYRMPVPSAYGDAAWWLTYTPVHLLWDGGVAVTVFFVLSGFVLCLPFAQGRASKWSAYYPQRLLRLYIPVWAAVAFACATIVVFPHAAPELVTGWVAGHPQELNITSVINDLTLFRSPGFSNSALWTLKWEVVFSLLLPVYVIFGGRWLRGWPVKICLVLGLLLAGALVGPADRPYQMGALYQLPVFALGAVLAFRWNDIGPRLDNLRRGPLIGLWMLAVLSLSSYWLAYAPGAYAGQAYVVAATRVAQAAGAVLLLALSARTGLWSNLLSTRGIRWLGSRSFSLYLIHEPIMVAAGSLAALSGVPVGSVIPGAIVVALIMTEIFFRLVERPSHRIARAVGKWISSRQATSPH
jgi:peptidoglycan/LPS O-acetylase OafA/YrhL